MTTLHFLHPEEGLKIVHAVHRLHVPETFQSMEFKGLCEIDYADLHRPWHVKNYEMYDPIILPEDEMRSKYPELYI